MPTPLPHYLLRAETYRPQRSGPRWRFTLTSIGAEDRLTASDAEPTTDRSRLELLAVVRGLEALDGPSRVTLLTRSRYVSRGIRRQLGQWREHRWQWERFGAMSPIRDFDLWRRIDRALEYHTIECCVWQSEEGGAAQPRYTPANSGWSIAAAIGKLRRGVLTPISALWPPTFTRAA
jgi:ribonuclease HI